MKLMEKLKKLKNTTNNLVEVTVKNENFNYFKDVSIYDVCKQNENVSFKIKYIDFIKLKKLNIYEIINNPYKEFVNKNKRKIFISLTACLFIITFFILNQFFIRKIEFKDSRYYDESIYNYVIANTKKIGKYYYFNDSINNISKKLRTKYYHFAYIGLSKKGSKVFIEIEEQRIKNDISLDNDCIGEFVSNVDAKICSIKISSGNVLIKNNDIVKKGQILVSSNLLYNEGINNSDKVVPLKGYIIGLIYDYKEVEVLKKETIEIVSNLSKKKMILNDKKINNSNYYIKKYNVFKVGNIYLQKVYLYNKEIIEIERDITEALEYAKYLIYYDYINKFIYNEEKVLAITNLNVIENERSFIFKFFVEAKINIINFKSY